jgi:hypothetical protein
MVVLGTSLDASGVDFRSSKNFTRPRKPQLT